VKGDSFGVMSNVLLLQDWISANSIEGKSLGGFSDVFEYLPEIHSSSAVVEVLDLRLRPCKTVYW